MPRKKINLEDVRKKLIALEGTIIDALIERAQFKTNDKAYIPGGVGFKDITSKMMKQFPILCYFKDYKGSYFDFMFKGTEMIDALAARFNAFDQYAFHRGNPPAIALRKYAKAPIADVDINLNPTIKLIYLNSLSQFCEKGDDGNYGDAVKWDTIAIQTISHRVHYGVLVMESKYLEDPATYDELVRNNDEIGIEHELTDLKKEREILNRVRRKARRKGLNPKFIADFYKNQIIPLTKIVEVEYLFKRNNK